MPIFNFIKKQIKKSLILLFVSFVLFQTAKWFFPENKISQKYIEVYSKFLSSSSKILKQNIPGLEDYFSKQSKDEKISAFDKLVDWKWDILDDMWNVFQVMNKYVMIQQWIMVMKNPEMAKEFATAWVWDVMNSIAAMKNYKKMEAEIYWDAWIENDQNYLSFQEIIEYQKIIKQINKWTKTKDNLINFINNLPKKDNKDFENLRKNLKWELLKVWNDKVKKEWWNLEKTFEKTFDEITDEDILIAE